MSVIGTRCWSEEYAIQANWAQAADQVLVLDVDGEWVGTGKQVADFRHDGFAALRSILEEQAQMGGNLAEEIPEIDRAMRFAKETD